MTPACLMERTLQQTLSASCRLSGALIAAFLISAISMVLAPQAALAQGPFTCNEELYIMQAVNDSAKSQLYTINRSDFNNLDPIGAANTRYNAIGYNPQDNYIYGIHDRSASPGTLGTVYRIGSDGTATSLGVPVNGAGTWPATAERWNAGTVLPDGKYVIVNDRGSGTGSPMWIVVLDVTTTPPTVDSAVQLSDQSSRFWDIAYRPHDGLVYGYDLGQSGNYQLQFATIDPYTGVVSHFGAVGSTSTPFRNGSSFFDSVGDIYLYGGELAVSPWTQDRFYIGDIDSPTTPPLGTYIELAQGATVLASDGTSCPYYVAMRKTVDPLTSYPGGTVTYTYDIGNYLDYDQTDVTFTDTMGDGRTFKAGTLSPVSPGGGTANAYAGTNTLQISDMTLSSHTMTSFSVDVLIPFTATSGTITNQALLTDLDGGLPDIPSDYPLLADDDDPTPLIIEAGTIYGHVYEDTDGSGGQNGLEPDLPNIDVVITDSKGNIQTVTTNIDGDWTANVPPGLTDAEIDESTLPLGYTQTDGTNPTTDVSVADGGSSNAGNDGFKPGLPTTIGDFVWLDLDGDGIQDNGEPGIEGVTVRLYDPGDDGQPGGTGPDADTLVDTTTTNGSGIYSFSTAAGDYFLEFAYPGAAFSPQGTTNPNGDTKDSDADANGQTAVRTFSPGGTDNDVDAGILPAVFGDRVWWDDSGDGIQNNGEVGAADVTVNLYDPGDDGQPGGSGADADTLLDTVPTNASGIYSFTVAPGDYFIEVEEPAGTAFTTQGAGGSDALDSNIDPNTGYSDVVSLASSDVDDTVDAGLLRVVLLIDKDTLTPSVAAGSQVTYTIVVSNAGGNTATGVVISDSLPAGFTYASTSSIEKTNVSGPENLPTPGATVPTWGLWNIQADGIVTITFVVDVDANTTPATYDNDAFANAGNHAQIKDDGLVAHPSDPNTLPSDTPEFDEDVTVTVAPAIDVIKEGPATATVGQTVVYTFTVTNDAVNGDSSPINSVAVVDNIAGAAALIEKAGGNQDGLLEAGETWTYTASYTIQGSDPDPLVNVAEATGQDGEGDPVSDIDNHSLDIVADIGTVDGHVYINNDEVPGYHPGQDTPLKDVSVTITDTNGTIYTVITDPNGYFSQEVPSGDTDVDVDDNDLPAGATLETGSTDPTTVPVPLGGTATDDTGYDVPQGKFDLEKRLNTPEPVRVGEVVSFTIRITNTGEVALTKIPITDTYDPDYLAFVGATPTPDTNAVSGTITWSDLTASTPHGYGAPLLPGVDSFFDIVVEFVAVDDTYVLPNDSTVNTAGTVNVQDVGGKILPDDQASASVQIILPTAVELADPFARSHEGRAMLGWRTVDETGSVAFHIYRTDSAGQRVRLTEAPIPAQHAGQTQGAAYTFEDGTLAVGERYVYELESITPTGSAAMAELGVIDTRPKVYLPLLIR